MAQFYSEHFHAIFATDHCHHTVKFHEMSKYFWDASSIESKIEDWEFGALRYPLPQEILKKTFVWFSI